MTAINFLLSDTLTVTIKGHADYAEKGLDIVCAAISSRATTLAEFVAIMYDGGMLEEKPKIRLNDGDALIECKPTKEALHYITNIFTYDRMGFEIIANTYPEYVKLNESSLR
jgi:uncharacterized protein YsxB (DUF464 family)